MNPLREAAQQALEALEWHYRQGHSNTLGGFRLKIDEKALRGLRAALAQQAEPVEPGAWVASKDGRIIYDDASTDDGLLRVSGDFENDEQRSRYAQRIVDKLNAALAQRAEPVQDEPVHDRHGACPTHCCPIHGCKYMHDDCPVVSGAVKPVYPRNNGCESCAEDALAQQAEPVQEPITRLFGTLPVHDTQQALAQQAEPDHETRAELAEQQVVQLAEERDHYRNLWQKAQQAEPVGQLAELQAMLRAEVDRLIAAGIQPQRKLVPLTEEEIYHATGHCGVSKYTAINITRAVERAHGIKE